MRGDVGRYVGRCGEVWGGLWGGAGGRRASCVRGFLTPVSCGVRSELEYTLAETDCSAALTPRRALFIRRVPQALQQGVLVVHLDRAREFHAHELLGQARDVGAERRAHLVKSCARGRGGCGGVEEVWRMNGGVRGGESGGVEKTVRGGGRGGVRGGTRGGGWRACGGQVACVRRAGEMAAGGRIAHLVYHVELVNVMLLLLLVRILL